MFHKFYQVSVTLHCTAKTLYLKFETNPEIRLRGLALYKKICDFPVPSRDVTNENLPGRKLFNYSLPGRVWSVTSRLVRENL
jgi:hypothetical protein